MPPESAFFATESGGAAAPDPAVPRTWIVALACTVASAAVFAPALAGPFLFDDELLIASNRAVHGFDGWQSWFTHDFWDLGLGATQTVERLRYYRPLVTASYALDWALGGGSPVLFHATNLALHAVVAGLCFFTLRRWCREPIAALMATLVFALHPTKAESVAWIAGRPDVLMVLGMLLATTGVALRLRGRRAGIGLEVFGTCVAYLSKEHAVALPLLAALEGWAMAGRPAPAAKWFTWRHPVVAAALPQAMVAGAYVVLRTVWFPIRQVEIHGLSSAEHLALVMETFGRYAELVLWPGDLSLTRAALRTTADGPVLSAGYVALGSAALVGLGVIAVAWRRSRPHLAVGAAFVLLTLLPVSNLVYSGFFALTSPRLLYLPLFGLAVALAIGLSVARRRTLALAATGVVIALLATRSFVRAEDFTSGVRFWDYELSHNPDVPVALHGAVQIDLASDHPRTALIRLGCAHAAAARSFSHTGEAGAFLLTALRILAETTPDVDTAGLMKQRAFLRALLRGNPDPAVLSLPQAQFELAQQSKAAQVIRRKSFRVALILADIESRLGNETDCVGAAGAAVASCPGCLDVAGQAAVLAARVGDFEQAFAWQAVAEAQPSMRLKRQRESLELARRLRRRAASAPPRLAAQLMAQCYWTLGAWGRASAALRPYQRAIEAAGPTPVIDYARIAYRAGDHKTARRLLERHVPEQAHTLLDEWTAATAHAPGDGVVPAGWDPAKGCYWGPLEGG